MTPTTEEMLENQRRILALAERMIAAVAEAQADDVCVAALDVALRMLQLEGRTVQAAFEKLVEVVRLMQISAETGVVIASSGVPS